MISELSIVYDKKGDYKKSLELLKIENELLDSIKYRELSKKVSEIKTEYEAEEKNKTIENLSTHKNSLQKQLNGLVPIIGILVFVLLLLYFFYKKYYKKTEELPPNFIRCHLSYIVNSSFIKQINTTSIVLIDKTVIPLSRTYKSNF